jgi:hypothetical protein
MSKWMEAIPLSEMSAAACAKALTFTWFSRFGVPETILSSDEVQIPVYRYLVEYPEVVLGKILVHVVVKIPHMLHQIV